MVIPGAGGMAEESIGGNIAVNMAATNVLKLKLLLKKY